MLLNIIQKLNSRYGIIQAKELSNILSLYTIILL